MEQIMCLSAGPVSKCLGDTEVFIEKISGTIAALDKGTYDRDDTSHSIGRVLA